MNLDLAKTIAAFGGLCLGVINLAIFSHKEYFRKPRVKACITSAYIRAVSNGTFDIQLDLELDALGGDLYLKEIYFKHQTPVFNPVREINKRSVYKAVNYPGYCALNTAIEKFESTFKELFKDSFSVANTKLKDKETKLISVIDRICTERSMDGYWEWPENNWELEVVTSANSITIPFAFKLHETNNLDMFVYS